MVSKSKRVWLCGWNSRSCGSEGCQVCLFLGVLFQLSRIFTLALHLLAYKRLEKEKLIRKRKCQLDSCEYKAMPKWSLQLTNREKSRMQSYDVSLVSILVLLDVSRQVVWSWPRIWRILQMQSLWSSNERKGLFRIWRNQTKSSLKWPWKICILQWQILKPIIRYSKNKIRLNDETWLKH